MRIFLIVVFTTISFSGHSQAATNNKSLWTLTYLKAKEGQKADLRAFIQKNWFAMDKRALEQGLLKQYHLLENSDATKEWDFVVMVQYRDETGYEGVKVEFEKIRQAHQHVLVNGKGIADVGRVVKAEEFLEVL